MNNMLIDLQVYNFISAWKSLRAGKLNYCGTKFNVTEKLSEEEFKTALVKAQRLYQAELNK